MEEKLIYVDPVFMSKSVSELSLGHIFAWMAEDLFVFECGVGEECFPVQTFNYRVPDFLYDIEKFVKRVVEPEKLVFDLNRIRTASSQEDYAYFASNSWVLGRYDHIYSRYKVSPYARIFFSAFEFLGFTTSIFEFSYAKFKDPNVMVNVLAPTLPELKQYGMHCLSSKYLELEKRPLHEVFSELILYIRQKGRSPEIRGKMKHRNAEIKNKVFSYHNYIKSLFNMVPALYILRLDLGYERPSIILKSDKQKQNENPVSVASAKREEVADIRLAPGPVVSFAQKRIDLRQFLNNSRCNNLFRDLLGYIWRYEQEHVGESCWHVILFFSAPSDLCSYTGLARKIGEFWRPKGGVGRFADCSLSTRTYKNLCTGLIHADEKDKRQELMNLVQYLVTKNYYLQLPAMHTTERFPPNGAHTVDKMRGCG